MCMCTKKETLGVCFRKVLVLLTNVPCLVYKKKKKEKNKNEQ